MKVISLNTWGGRAGKEKLLSFLKKYQDVDVLCLQEIWSAHYAHLEGVIAGGRALVLSEIMTRGLQDISDALPEFVSYFHPHYGNDYGLLMLVRKSLRVKDVGEIYVYKHKGWVAEGDVGNHARNIQFVTIDIKGTFLTVVNFHGLWNGQGKGDSEERLLQSEKIVAFLKTLPNPHLVCGDFNLLPDTESVKKLEHSGLRNLIKEYGVTSTRTSLYTKPEKFADYVFVSTGIPVKSFKVLPEEVSDHSALIVELGAFS